MTFHFTNWTWHSLTSSELDQEKIRSLAGGSPLLERWASHIHHKENNELWIETLDSGSEVICGSLLYTLDEDDGENSQILHYYLSSTLLITVDFGLENLKDQSSAKIVKKLNGVEDAVDGFFVLLSGIVNNYLYGIDHFEIKLKDVLHEVHQHNNKTILDHIYELRHSLLIWKSYFLPVIEILKGAEEAYLDEVKGKKEYKRTCKQVERGSTLIGEYQDEIDTLIRLEEVYSTQRGNEIMKSLTVLTVMFTPLTAWSALWGMNFKYMPELDWIFGYPLALLLIIGTTVSVYIYMKRKGWTGDLLSRKKKREN
ncbi:magnesium transporter CorA family protein [Metabacillus sp. RGM 3146]|uniref:magnesium transporter CorA family protein n=1 Tax=Metabacillus sp. RGM 3146 TaxID=3401092 RepID=UPI003B9C1C2B